MLLSTDPKEGTPSQQESPTYEVEGAVEAVVVQVGVQATVHLYP